MEWRRATWAAAGALLFATAAGMMVNWAATAAAAAHPLPWWPMIVFMIMMIIGILAFLVAMMRPQWLPDKKYAEMDQQAEDAKHAHRRRVSMFPPIFGHTNWDQHYNTQALNEHSQVMREYINLERSRTLDKDDLENDLDDDG
jgi:fatty acid desaturase